MAKKKQKRLRKTRGKSDVKREAEKQPSISPDENKNDYGGFPDLDFKKNLGCG